METNVSISTRPRGYNINTLKFLLQLGKVNNDDYIFLFFDPVKELKYSPKHLTRNRRFVIYLNFVLTVYFLQLVSKYGVVLIKIVLNICKVVHTKQVSV